MKKIETSDGIWYPNLLISCPIEWPLKSLPARAPAAAQGSQGRELYGRIQGLKDSPEDQPYTLVNLVGL